MSKKHYELIAAAIRAARNEASGWDCGESGVDCVVESLCRAFAADNARFDSDRFSEACERKGV
jgi:hypothetical protein